MNLSPSLPALLGGPAIRPQGPPDWPMPDDEIKQALDECYRDGSWGRYLGGGVALLENRLSEYHQIGFALACASGTLAVELALRGLKIGPGDEVLLAAYDYPGNFLCVHAVGAQPVLVDVAAHNWNLDPEQVAPSIGPNTRAIIASHLHGGLVPMRRLRDIADAHGLALIEDAAQCPGALVDGKKAGTWGDAGILSFGGSKLLSAGRGGAVLTPSAAVHQRMRTFLNRGNNICPLSELQAAVLPPQLAKLDQRNRQRQENADRLAGLLRDIPGLKLFSACGSALDQPAFYKVGFQFDEERFGLSRKILVAALRAEGLAFDEGFRALHHGRSARRFRQGSELTEAEKAHHGTLILHHPILLGEAADMEAIRQGFLKIQIHAERLRLLQP